MSDIQIPQRNPQYVAPIAPPTDLIQALYNRPKAGEIASQQVGQAVNDIYSRYIEQQKLKASAFGEGGPFLYNLLYGRTAPTTPPGTVAGEQPPAPTTAQATPQGPVAGQVQPSQAQSPLSQDQYHAVASHLGVPPDFEGYQKAISGLTGQMQQSADMYGPSKFGQANQQMLGGQLNAMKTGMEAQTAPLTYAKTAGEVAMQPTEAALKSQQLVNATAEIPEKHKATVAAEISKQGQSSQQIGQIRQLYTDLQGALGKNKPGVVSTLSGRANQLTGGRIGSSTAADVLNAANPLATALNTELSHRFNSGEVQLLSNSLVPSPSDTPEYAAKKMERLGHMIGAMESGNEQNVKNVANAITGGNINTTIMPTRTQPVGQVAQVPQGRVTVVSPTGQIGHIPQAQLKAALAKGYKQQ